MSKRFSETMPVPEAPMSNQDIGAIVEELEAASAGVLRLCEALRYTVGISKAQMERVERFRKAVAALRDHLNHIEGAGE